MPDVMFTGPEGRLEGRYHQSKEEHAPIALILHPHPQYGGTMNHKVVFSLFHVFVNRGFSVLRFNTRGVGRSQGRFDNGMGELSDAAAALDWLQSMNADAKSCWIAGYSFGAWIGMQLLMRRPEIDCFVSVSPPANSYDFAFLAPCPSSGLIVGESLVGVLMAGIIGAAGTEAPLAIAGAGFEHTASFLGLAVFVLVAILFWRRVMKLA